MSVIIFFQTLHCPFFDFLTQVEEFLTSLPFLVFLFAFVFLFVSKDLFSKVYLGFYASFFAGYAFLKNLIARPRPFQIEPSIDAIRKMQSFSMPSLASMNVALLMPLVSFKWRKACRAKKISLICLTVLSFIFVLFGKLYSAQNYLLDILLGFILGSFIYMLCFKFFTIKKDACIFLFLLLPIITIVSHLILSKDGVYDKNIFEYCAFFISTIIGLYLENRFVKYKIQNNLFTILLKAFTTLIVFGALFLIFHFLPRTALLCLVEYLFAGFILTLLLPLIFNYYNKFAYVFSSDVDRGKILFSAISLGKKQTYHISKRLDDFISSGDTVILTGDLGAGKSEFVRGYLLSKNVKNKITSPTFTLVNEYFAGSNHFYHFDLYRIDDEDEVKNLDFEEIIDDKEAIKFIEWAEKAPSYLPKHYKKITIVKLGDTTRNIILEEY